MIRKQKKRNRMWGFAMQKISSGILLVGIFLAVFAGVSGIGRGFGVNEGKGAEESDVNEKEKQLEKQTEKQEKLPEDGVAAKGKDGSYTEETKELFSYRVLDCSDDKAVKKLIYQVVDSQFIYDRVEEWDTLDFEIKEGCLSVELLEKMNRPDSFRRMTGDYSALFLALMPDITEVRWKYQEAQYGGNYKEVAIQYDWSMMQKKNFVDASLYQVTETATARAFGANEASLQMLIDHMTYFERGKTEEKKMPEFEVHAKKMKKELKKLPRTLTEARQCKEIYIQSAYYYEKEESKVCLEKECHREIWEKFYQRIKRKKAASVIVAGPNLLNEAEWWETGSVAYCYICYDGVNFHVLYDFVNTSGTDTFDEGLQQGNYLLESVENLEGDYRKYYYITDDYSLSHRDVMYSMVYSGIGEYTNLEPAKAHIVMTEILQEEGQ